MQRRTVLSDSRLQQEPVSMLITVAWWFLVQCSLNIWRSAVSAVESHFPMLWTVDGGKLKLFVVLHWEIFFLNRWSKMMNQESLLAKNEPVNFTQLHKLFSRMSQLCLSVKFVLKSFYCILEKVPTLLGMGFVYDFNKGNTGICESNLLCAVVPAG